MVRQLPLYSHLPLPCTLSSSPTAGSLAAQLKESQEQLLNMQKYLQDYEQQVRVKTGQVEWSCDCHVTHSAGGLPELCDS